MTKKLSQIEMEYDLAELGHSYEYLNSLSHKEMADLYEQEFWEPVSVYLD